MTLILKNLTKLFESNYNNLDTRFWVQKVILKKYLKKINNHTIVMALILENLGKLFEPKYKSLDGKFWVQKIILKKYLKKN